MKFIEAHLLGVMLVARLIRPTTAHAPLFSWPLYPTLSYATALPKPLPTSTYAPPFGNLAHLVKNQSTTTWASIASPTDSAAKYGNVAWSSLWAGFNITAPPFTTTAFPTPVPTSELAKPTPLPLSLERETPSYKFPVDFISGFTGAALQIEGAVKNEGRGPTYTELILLSREETAKGGGKPDITTLNYYLYKQDIARLAAVGVKSYAFTISWSRILPFGTVGSPVNREAIDHYNDVINTVLEYGMIPVVTLQHFDTPITLATNTSFQGWDHPDFIDSFVNYAQICLTHYADRVGTWITFNEPNGDAALFKNWASGYNIVMAHAKVVHWYREVLNGTGKFSMKFEFSAGFSLPLDPTNELDIAAANRRMDFEIGFLANPLFLGLPIPDSVTSTLGAHAPNFTVDELAFANGTCDYLAFDIYTTSYETSLPGGVEVCIQDPSNAVFPYCTVNLQARDGWDVGAKSNNGGRQFYQHFRTVLKYLDSIYPAKNGIMVTEIGFAIYNAAEMTLEQEQSEITQSIFYQSMLNEVLKSIHEDGINVIGFLGWSFVNNWEWGEYDDCYGVQVVNHTTLERFYKRAIFDFTDFIAAH
ncbi:glycoside hydrolase [Cadophora sp. MPI-SDFR-AT-0126]|nr:glycoside hydrolase [Leotiomycetes sp. MPI-SDFR-AT-0126]